LQAFEDYKTDLCFSVKLSFALNNVLIDYLIRQIRQINFNNRG